jgi:hypothetical protein
MQYCQEETFGYLESFSLLRYDLKDALDEDRYSKRFNAREVHATPTGQLSLQRNGRVTAKSRVYGRTNKNYPSQGQPLQLHGSRLQAPLTIAA